MKIYEQIVVRTKAKNKFKKKTFLFNNHSPFYIESQHQHEHSSSVTGCLFSWGESEFYPSLVLIDWNNVINWMVWRK